MNRNYDERLRNIRYFANPFEIPEAKFAKLFRVPKSGALIIIRTLDDPLLNEGGIPKQIKVVGNQVKFRDATFVVGTFCNKSKYLGSESPRLDRFLSNIMSSRYLP